MIFLTLFTSDIFMFIMGNPVIILIMRSMLQVFSWGKTAAKIRCVQFQNFWLTLDEDLIIFTFYSTKIPFFMLKMLTLYYLMVVSTAMELASLSFRILSLTCQFSLQKRWINFRASEFFQTKSAVRQDTICSPY